MTAAALAAPIITARPLAEDFPDCQCGAQSFRLLIQRKRGRCAALVTCRRCPRQHYALGETLAAVLRVIRELVRA